MRFNKKNWLVLIFSFVMMGQLVFAQLEDKELSDSEKVYGLSVFWKEVSYNFAFFDQVQGLNWDSVYQDFIPRVIATESTYEYYRELQRFCALLKDGHTNIYFPKSITKNLSSPKILLAEYDRRMYVRNVDSNLVSDIPIGSEIIQINGKPSIDFVKENVMPYVSVSAEHILWDYSIKTALKGEKGSFVKLTYIRPDGQQATYDFERSREGVRWFRKNDKRQLVHLEWIEKDIALIELNSFSDTAIVSQFESVLPELYRCKGIIIDLRYNTGGSSRTATNILQHFSSDTLWGSVWRTPKHIASYKAWGRYYYQNGFESEYIPYYKNDAWYYGDKNYVIPDSGRKIEVPIVVLFGKNTASAAEDFLIFANDLEQFLYVGEQTFGSTGQPLILDNLPGGGYARICTKRDTYRDGSDFVGFGIQPDILIKESASTLIDGSDTVLQRGLYELQRKIKNLKYDEK